MLRPKALTELLTENTDDRLCKRWYIMTPNGTLLAYSQPTDILDLRKQAAIAAITWQERQHQMSGEHSDLNTHGTVSNNSLHALNIESHASNIIMRVIQNQLLLVLEGGVPPNRPAFETRVTAETAEGTLQHQRDNDEAVSIRSGHTTGGSKVAVSLLKLQRTKLDQLAEIIRTDLEQSGFHMPEEQSTTVF